jgi:hypothetical protein
MLPALALLIPNIISTFLLPVNGVRPPPSIGVAGTLLASPAPTSAQRVHTTPKQIKKRRSRHNNTSAA